MANKSKLIIICGPTSSGKSGLAMKLAPEFSGEIVIADSRQVYKDLTIGTSKPTKKDQQQAPHHLVDIVEPSKVFTVGQYKKIAEKAIADIHARNKLPFLVGGTALYIDSVARGLDIPEIEPDQKLRNKLEKQTETELFAKLEELDPEFAKQVDKQNKRRLVRAIEVCEKSGQKFSDLRKKKPVPYETLFLAIKWPREELYNRIDETVEDMIEQGLLDEVKGLLAAGLTYERLDNLGLEYRFASQIVAKKISEDEGVQKLKYASHQFAKRQLTWFRKYRDLHWLEPEEAETQARKILQSRT